MGTVAHALRPARLCRDAAVLGSTLRALVRLSFHEVVGAGTSFRPIAELSAAFLRARWPARPVALGRHREFNPLTSGHTVGP